MCAPRVPCPRFPVGSSPARCMRRLPTPSRPRARMPPALHVLFSPLQNATVFNQPLSFDTSKVTDMQSMFGVRCLRRRHRPTPSHLPTHVPLSTRQGCNALSEENKLLIRCAWSGNTQFTTLYGSVVLTLTATGNVDDYPESRKLDLQRDIALAAAVNKSLVTIQVTAWLGPSNRRLPRLDELTASITASNGQASDGQASDGQASVIIMAAIAVPANTTAAVLQALASTLGTAAAASEELGITVESAPSIVNVMPPPSAPPPVPPPTPPTPPPPPPVPPPSLPPLPPLQVVSVLPRGAVLTGGQIVRVTAMGLSDASAYEGADHASGVVDCKECKDEHAASASSFTDKASLRTAVVAYNTNPTSAIETYGPISDWGVSAITSMNQLFKDLGSFNADVSAWDTSGVTDMSSMFEVCSPPCTLPSTAHRKPSCHDAFETSSRLPGRTPPRIVHVACTFAPPLPHALPYLAPHFTPHAPLVTRQGAYMFNQPLSFDTSSVTDMSSMFEVRPARASRPMSNYSSLHAACTTTAPQYLTPHVIPHVHVHVHVCTHHEPPFDLAVCGWLQPASEFRRVQRHEHEPDV